MSFVFDVFIEKLSSGGVDWESLDLRCLLTERASSGDPAFDPSPALTTVGQVLLVAPEMSATGYARQSGTEADSAITDGRELGVDTQTFSIEAGKLVGGALWYAHVTDDSDSWPVSWHPEVIGVSTADGVEVVDVAGAVRLVRP